MGKKSLCNWILQNTQVVQYPIANNFLKVSIDIHSESQLVAKMLLHFYFLELHNSMVSPAEEGGLK